MPCCLNAGAALYLDGKAETMAEGVKLAAPAHRQRRGHADPGKTHRGEQPPGGRRMTILDQLAAHARQRVADGPGEATACTS